MSVVNNDGGMVSPFHQGQPRGEGEKMKQLITQSELSRYLELDRIRKEAIDMRNHIRERAHSGEVVEDGPIQLLPYISNPIDYSYRSLLQIFGKKACEYLRIHLARNIIRSMKIGYFIEPQLYGGQNKTGEQKSSTPFDMRHFTSLCHEHADTMDTDDSLFKNPGNCSNAIYHLPEE